VERSQDLQKLVRCWEDNIDIFINVWFLMMSWKATFWMAFHSDSGKHNYQLKRWFPAYKCLQKILISGRDVFTLYTSLKQTKDNDFTWKDFQAEK
jgi:hypothetical protein